MFWGLDMVSWVAIGAAALLLVGARIWDWRERGQGLNTHTGGAVFFAMCLVMGALLRKP